MKEIYLLQIEDKWKVGKKKDLLKWINDTWKGEELEKILKKFNSR